MPFPSIIVVPTSDSAAAKAIYSALLGIEPYVDSAYYIGYRTEQGEIGIDPSNPAGGPTPYWDVDDLDAVVEALTARGAIVTREPSEVGGGMTVAVLADSDGNPIGLRHASKA